MRFNGKIALITGGGTGIGKAAAIGFAREGAKVVICGRREEPLKEVVAEIVKNGGEATYFACDVRKSELVDKLVQDATDKYDRIDILFNNAGISLSNPIEATTDEEVNELLDINVKGEFWALRAVIRQMKKQGSGGAIINMSAMAGLIGRPWRSAYCASKGAILSMTRSIAMEVAKDNIRVNSICPGTIDTDMTRETLRAAPVVAQGLIDSQPMKRIASAEEVASAVLFLASDDASFITGASLTIDGGFTAGK